ncbi:DEAD/DEAH box helicase, partial [archaeon]
MPQFLLESESHGPTARIAITQPRRISAISLAERVAYERCEEVGQEGGVGYSIRLEKKGGERCQVMYMTPGVLLRKMLLDRNLDQYTHIIVDEAHERDRYTEFLLIFLRDLCARRKDIHLILMSATMHTEKLSAYFGDIPHVYIGGSVFPVQEFYLEHILAFTMFK